MDKMEFSVDVMALTFIIQIFMEGKIKNNKIDQDKLHMIVDVIDHIKDSNEEFGDVKFEDIVDHLYEKYCR